MESKNYMVITAQQNEAGEWILDGDGNEAQEGYGYATRGEAMEAAARLWPSNSVWEGKRTAAGWRIRVD